MKDSVFNQKKRYFFLIFTTSIFIFIPIFIGVKLFSDSASDEVINLWYDTELPTLQQGNLLTSITKLQRVITKSAIIKAVKVIDNQNREMINFNKSSENISWPNLNLIKKNNELKSHRINFYKSVYTFSNGNLNIYILTTSTLMIYMSLGVVTYYVFLILIFIHFLKKEIKTVEKINTQEKIDRLANELLITTQISTIAKQVSHDIRSPLAALNMVIDQIENIPEKYRMIIRGSATRINDIANNLLTTNNSKKESIESTELLGPLIDSIVSEKRFQYLKKSGIELKLDLSSSYGLFATIIPIEFRRTISNILDNAFESFTNNGQINIQIIDAETCIELIINDNGSGIPEEILSKIGSKGFTHGKKSGSGLGIFHAITTIEKMGGSIKYSSQLGIGTEVKIVLNKAPTPLWFKDKIRITNIKKIIILDDDENIHNIWVEKFSSYSTILNIIKFTNPDEFSNYISKLSDRDFLCLIDFEFIGFNVNGVDIINQNNISNQSILITSRSEEINVREQANNSNIKLIPKSLVHFVPLEIRSIKNDYFDYVLIEDDLLIRMTWEAIAYKRKVKLLSLSSIENFEEYLDSISKTSTQIYIDSMLGNNSMRGEDFAVILHNKGFQNLYLATGLEKIDSDKLYWLKLTGKECPFR